VRRELAEIIVGVELNRYPDTCARELRAQIAARLECDAQQIVLGNGSAEIFGFLFGLFNAAERPVLVVPVPAFAMFGNSGRAYGYEVREVPLRRDFELDLPALRRALHGATLCIITRPNNPTGSLCSRRAVEALIADCPQTLFIIDEAYAAFAPGCSMLAPVRPDNQVLMAPLSNRALAALRLGYCVAHPDLVRALDKVRMPYNLSQITISLTQHILMRHSAVLDGMVQATVTRREAMRAILERIDGATVHGSHANMVLVTFADRAGARHWSGRLVAHGVQVRDVSDEPGFAELNLPGCLRVSVGNEPELELLARAIAAIQGAPAGFLGARAAAGA
jgi:histidinol-phosphate aminotransferase